MPQLLWYDSLPSTMSEAHRLAQDGKPHGTTVIARSQTAGRGRQGKAWSAPIGGLWMSMIARPEPGKGLAALSLRVGLATARALEFLQPELPRLKLKWPNDIMLNDRKLSGILVEAHWSGTDCLWAVVGVGINLQNQIPAELVDLATSLSEGVPATAEPGLSPDDVAPCVANAVAEVADHGVLSRAELAEWASRDWLKGTKVAGPVQGVVQGITANGSLLVAGREGVVEVNAGLVTPGS